MIFILGPPKPGSKSWLRSFLDFPGLSWDLSSGLDY